MRNGSDPAGPPSVPLYAGEEGDSAALKGRGVQSVEIGGRLLAILAEGGQPMMLRDLAQAAELTPGQAHAYVTSLRKLALVEQEGASGRYRLGPFALQLGLARLRGSDPYRLAAEQVPELAARLNLMVAITVWGTHGPTIVLVQEATNYIHANVRPGGMFTVTGTATGKVFAAWMPRTLIDRVVEQELQAAQKGWSDVGALSGEVLEREVDKARRNGIAVTSDLPVPGISALSAPVFNHSGHLQLAITLIGPTRKVDVSLEGEHAAALLAFTRRISADLGFRG